MNDIVLQAENVSKVYKLGQFTARSFFGDLRDLFVKRSDNEREEKPTNESIYALKDVSFKVNKGQAIALIGRNGAGKSTLLKLISRITVPTEGVIRYKGHVASLLEVGTGFNSWLTGRENIYLNGAIMGLSRNDVTKRLDEIIEFSEIGKFIDTPVRRYSSGMYVKLGFAVAAHLNPDILICDEVLAVGDTRFQQKCLGKMSELANEHTVIYVSHNMHTLRQLCTQALYLENGRLTYSGELEHAISLYDGASRLKDTDIDLSSMTHAGDRGKFASLLHLRLNDVVSCEYQQGSCISMDLSVRAKEDVQKLSVGVLISRPGSGTVATSLSSPIYTACAGDEKVLHLNLPLGGLSPGEYEAEIQLCFIDPTGRMISYDVVPHAFSLAVTPNLECSGGMLWNEKRHGLFKLPDISLRADNF